MPRKPTMAAAEKSRDLMKKIRNDSPAVYKFLETESGFEIAQPEPGRYMSSSNSLRESECAELWRRQGGKF